MVESILSKGSIFSFTIPVTLADNRNIETFETQKEQVVIGMAAKQFEWRILIVEDVADNRLLLRRQLESVGFKVLEAENGEQGIQQFKDWKPHLIWMDISMPVMDGYEATRRIRALPGGKEVKILALTASLFKKQEEEILEVGFDEAFHKPYQQTTILNAMREYLGVQYVYQDIGDASTQEQVMLTETDIAKLPAQWCNQFHSATILGDLKVMRSLTNSLPESESETKAKLESYINEFQMERLITVFDGWKRGAAQNKNQH